MDIHRRESEGIILLDLKGRLIVGEACTRLRDQVAVESGKGARQLILNLEQVEYIDSTGLGSMVICFTTLQKLGGALKLVSLNRRNIELLVLTKLSTVFEVFGDEQDAINSFFPERNIKRFDILSFVRDQEGQ